MTTMSIEPAKNADYALFRRLFEELETGDPVTPEAEFERNIVPNMLVARAPAGEALGYVFAELFGHACYVRHIVTSPPARKKGVGRALLAKVAAQAAARGARQLELNVKLENHAAIRLYESFGMRAVYETVVLRLAWRDLPPPKRALSVLEVDAALAREVEARFAMPAGLIVGHAASPLHVVRAIQEGATICAVGSFRPSFPGVFPLRAETPDQALAVLAALCPHAVDIQDSERPWRSRGVQIAVEDALETAATLIAAGGREVFRIAHMQGPIGQTMS